MSFLNSRLLVVLTFILCQLHLASALRNYMDRVECEAVDKNFGAFSECSVKKIGKSLLTNVHYHMYRQNVSNITIRAALYRKQKVFDPYLHDETIDFCDFVKTSKRNYLWNYVYSVMKSFSNMNHTCPYSGDIILKNFSFERCPFTAVQLPGGIYMVAMNISVNGDIKVKGQAFAVRK